MEGNKGNTVLLTVIGVATLLVALVGATFAYFSATTEGDRQSITATTATLGNLSWTATPQSLEVVNHDKTTNAAKPGEAIIPGAYGESSFVVTYENADATYNYSYDLSLVVATNTFTTSQVIAKGEGELKGQLVATLNATSSVTANTNVWDASKNQTVRNDDVTFAAHKITVDMTNGAAWGAGKYQLLHDVVITPGETQSYAVRVDFKDLDANQNDNQGKEFAGHLLIDEVKLLDPSTGGQTAGQVGTNR